MNGSGVVCAKCSSSAASRRAKIARAFAHPLDADQGAGIALPKKLYWVALVIDHQAAEGSLRQLLEDLAGPTEHRPLLAFPKTLD